MMKSGFVADGVVKLLVAALGGVFLTAVEDLFSAPRWLVITALVLLFLSAATEVSYGVRRGEKRYLKYPLLFDVFVLAAIIVGIILAGNPAGAYILFGVVALGSLAVAIVFTTGENGPGFGEQTGSGTA